MKSGFRYLVIAGFVLFSGFAALAQRQVPEFTGVWVVDPDAILSAQVKQGLEQALKAHRDSTSNQIAVYIFNDLQGEEVSDYAYKVASKWKLGQEKKDNGALLLIAVKDRKLRIEVGQGLEGALTDIESRGITRNVVIPYLKRNDYDGAVVAGVGAIIQAISGEYKNEAPPSIRRKNKRSPWVTLIIVVVVIILMSRRGGGGGGFWSPGGGFIPMGGFGGSSGSGGGWSGPDFGGGGSFGGGGASDSW